MPVCKTLHESEDNKKLLRIYRRLEMTHTNETLSKNELQIMELFWQGDKYLTSNDISKHIPEWNNNGYLHSLLRKLELKGFIKQVDRISGTTRTVKLYAPLVKKEEYATKLLSTLNIDQQCISEIAYSLAKEVSGDRKEKVISELESILEKLKASN